MATTPDLEPGERLDELGVRNWRIIQREDEFRFSLDAVLLAHFATIRPRARVVDLGCGGGAVALFLLARGVDAVSGLELNPRLADMAGRTAALNGVAGQLSIVCGDVGAYYRLPRGEQRNLYGFNSDCRRNMESNDRPRLERSACPSIDIACSSSSLRFSGSVSL